MNIQVSDRLKVFSHLPGHETMIPGTHWKVQAFPAALFIESCETGEKKSLFWSLEGPVSPFTVEQDINAFCVRIYGSAKQGYFRFTIRKQEKDLVLQIEKAPLGLRYAKSPEEGLTQSLVSGDILIVQKDLSIKNVLMGKERLFLGSTKQKLWDRIRQQEDLQTLLPLWFALGQVTPEPLQEEKGSVFSLLDSLKECCAQKDTVQIKELFIQLLLVGFSYQGFIPRAKDMQWQGILPLNSIDSSSALSLLTKGAKIIRSLFFQEKEEEYSILPCVPRGFVCGKLFFITTNNGDRLAFEWSKDRIRKMMLFAHARTNSLKITLPRSIRSCRLRRNEQDRGSLFIPGQELTVERDGWLFFDRFLE